MNSPLIPRPIKANKKPSMDGERGQALVELVVIIMICLIIGFGIYEVGSFLHNVSVMNRAVESGAVMASRGAPHEDIEDVIIAEAKNLLYGAFISQDISEDGIIIQVWNPETNERLAPTDRSDVFPPDVDAVAENIFRAQGYDIRVGVVYHIGIYIPFLGPITMEQPIVGKRTIQARNDVDRDGMVDSQEAGLLQWCTGNTWTHPVHRDQHDTMDAESGWDIDGDGLAGASDTFPYDHNNNNVEDKYDADDGSGSRNDLQLNPLVGPNDWSSLPVCAF